MRNLLAINRYITHRYRVWRRNSAGLSSVNNRELTLDWNYFALHRSTGKLNQRVGVHCILFFSFVPRYGSMSAHIRSTVALLTDMVMGVCGAFSENISNF